ncbi:MAG: beta-N-acetylhexosaminidase, partial [Odoribacter sp.]|nr:beta-N-acetylhexosaminidase [Odoribacter sp.]
MLKINLLFLFLFLTLLSFGNIPQSDSNSWVEETLESMTLEEKIGQLFMIAVYSNKDSNYEDNIEKTIEKHNIGGLIFFQGDPIRQVTMTNRYQENAKYPLLIGMDAEHGVGWRLQNSMEFPKMLIDGAIPNDSLIYDLAAAIARHCREIGVHINFAPVADINNNPRNSVIGIRSFGEDRENVFHKSMMYIAGSLSENVLPVLKHFPGHGDTETDSHHALPIIAHSRERLDSIELYPFRRLIEQQIPAIMIGHLNTTSLDSSDIPASLSPRIVKDLLQEEWNYKGLLFTDAMNMKGVIQGLESGEADLKALMAGNDILLFPENVERAIRRIKKAVSDDLISEEYINAKCRKILEAKYKYVVPYNTPIDTTNLWARLNTAEDIALKQELYKSALTLVINKDDFLPL